MDLGILNTVIAMVVVLLVLSLLVQSVQMLLKKLLKLKSKQIEDSLRDLFDQAIAGATPATQQAGNADGPAADTGSFAPARAAAPAAGYIGQIRNFARLLIVGRPGPASPAAEIFTNRVLDEFKKIGRVTKFGTPVLDSLSKEDLFKVMAKFESENFFPDYAEKFKEVCSQILALKGALEAITGNETLRGSASAKLAEIRTIMAPIFNNVEAILDGEKKVKPKVLFADLLRLRQLDIGGVLKLLNEAQEAIAQERAVATQAGKNDEVTQLDTISTNLAELAKLIGGLSQKFDEAVSPLRSKLEQVEVWFDTVTQSFDERYTRHMKTVSIYISIVVVILLNASFFDVYRSLSTNEVQRNLIAQAAPGILEQARRAQSDASPTDSPTPTPAESPSPQTSASPTDSPTPTPTESPSPQTGASPTDSPSPTPGESPSPQTDASPAPSPSVKEQIEESRQAMQALVDTYKGFGFSPVTGQQFESFLKSLGGWTAYKTDPQGKQAWAGLTLAKNDKGAIVNENNIPIPPNCQEKDKDGKDVVVDGKVMKCSPAWRNQTGAEWWQSRKDNFVTLFGWAIMVMLLSVGAPFWQDTLESLFGIKNLLRQKSGTQNIESQSGTGQPKE